MAEEGRSKRPRRAAKASRAESSPSPKRAELSPERAAAPPRAHIVHCVPGRARFKVPSRRGDRGYFDRLARKLSQQEGIIEVTTNPLTGSVLVRHTSPVAEVVKLASGLVFLADPMELSTPAFTTELATRFEKIDQRVTSLTRGEFNFASLAFLAFLGFGIAQVLEGKLMSPASQLFWTAFVLLRMGQSMENRPESAG